MIDELQGNQTPTIKPKVEIKVVQSSNKADGNTCDPSARLLGAKIPPRDAQRTDSTRHVFLEYAEHLLSDKLDFP